MEAAKFLLRRTPRVLNRLHASVLGAVVMSGGSVLKAIARRDGLGVCFQAVSGRPLVRLACAHLPRALGAIRCRTGDEIAVKRVLMLSAELCSEWTC